MKFSKLATSIGLTIGSVLFVSNSAQAAGFTSNVSFEQNPDKGDITQNNVFLDSIEQNGRTIFERDFSYVDRVVIGDNDEHTVKNTGAASTDHGDHVKGIGRRENLREGNASDEQNIVDFMGNNNLNKIIDTEDKGSFAIDFLFDSDIESNNLGLDSLFFWERGFKQDKQKGNSDLLIQAIDATGNTIGDDLFLSRKTQQYAGFSINTKEIGKAQAVGSWGVSFADLGLTEEQTFRGVRVMSEKAFNGPDYKIIASNRPSGKDFAQAAKVPEPGTIIGLGSVAAIAFVRRRKSK